MQRVHFLHFQDFEVDDKKKKRGSRREPKSSKKRRGRSISGSSDVEKEAKDDGNRDGDKKILSKGKGKKTKKEKKKAPAKKGPIIFYVLQYVAPLYMYC